MNKVNVAFIGCGQFAKVFHYSTLSEMDDVEIVAACDLNEELLNETCDRFNVEARYTDYNEMFDKEEIDAVYAIMRPQYLKSVALDVIKAGKHIFVEKPAGLNTAETKELAEAAEKASVKSGVGTNRRFAKVYRKAKEEVEKNGHISTVISEFHKNLDSEMFGMSVLTADGLHLVDPLRWMLGEAVEVNSHAETWFDNGNWEHSKNVWQALIRFESGASAVFTSNRRCGARREYMEVHGNGVSCYIRAPETLEIWRDGEKEPELITGEELAGDGHMLKTYGYWDENRDFIESIKEDRMPECNLSDNLKTMELCDEINNGSSMELKGRC